MTKDLMEFLQQYNMVGKAVILKPPSKKALTKLAKATKHARAKTLKVSISISALER
jgi:hypothetical protein